MVVNDVYDLVPIDDIDLDTQNPRIARFLEIYPDQEITPERIALALGADAPDEDSGTSVTFAKLRESIKMHGRIIQPIVVKKAANGRLVCIDGNTRLALYRDFRAKKVAGAWDRIPAIIHPQLSDSEADAVRLQAHLIGPRPWDPYSKAKYLNDLSNKQRFPMSELVEYCGGSTKMVQELIDAFNDMETYYRPALDDGQVFDIRRFSSFVELQKVGVKESISNANHSIGDFARWVISRKLPKNADVRLLPRILRNSKARQIFEQLGAAEAEKVLDHPDLSKTLKDAHIAELCRAVRQAYDQILNSEVRRLREDPSLPEIAAIRDAHESLSALLRDISEESD